MNIEDKKGTTVLRRPTDYTPSSSFRSWLIGRPLQTADAPNQTIGKFIGLAVFSSDALSSVAYGPQEILLILALAGTAAFQYFMPVIYAIICLLVILTISYEQTIHAYPGGGGAYIVARDNLGELPAQVAAASLLMDYILTVAVSISSGVAQLVSAFPGIETYKVEIAVGMVLLIMLINMRGVKESGVVFAIPTYFFLFMMFLTIVIGFIRMVTGGLAPLTDQPTDLVNSAIALQPISLFLILRAFSSGTTALTGVEAISNGITAFKEPRTKNAGLTLIWMSVILGAMVFGIGVLANHIVAYPSEEETVISQLARAVYDSRSIFYLATISSTTIILMMAANTAFADFPRLSAIAAADGFLPRQFTYRGSRLVYSRGIVALAGIACGLIVVFSASVTKLIPLYAIGVFLSFTLSQSGMARRWWKSGHLKEGEQKIEAGSTVVHDKRWLFKMIVNGLGAVCTAMVAVIFAITKFSEGAFIIVFLIPLFVSIFSAIHRHYKHLAKSLSLDHFGAPPHVTRHRVIISIGGVHRGTLAALRYARGLSDDITAVHVSVDADETQKILHKWESWGDGIRLVILESPYRLFLEPLLEYIDEIDKQRQPGEIMTIVVPQFISQKWYTRVLHTRTADTLRTVLLNRSDVVIMEVPYQTDEPGK